VLTVTELLRRHGVVGSFVEFYGAGLAGLPIADRATIGKHVAGVRLDLRDLPDRLRDLTYLSLSGRSPRQIELVEAYARAQGLWHDEHSEQPTFSETIELDLAGIVPSIAGPQAAPGPGRTERRTDLLPRGARRLRAGLTTAATRPPPRASLQ